MLESLLRTFPSEVFEGILSDGKVITRMTSMLKYIGYPPVGDLLVILVALTPIPRSSPLYGSCAGSRWKFFSALSEWILMLRIADIVVNPTKFCVINDYVTAEQQSAAAAQTLQELIEKLAIEDAGEILLQPLGYTTSLLDNLVTASIRTTEECYTDSSLMTSRRSSLRLLSYLLKRSANAESICFVSSPGQPPTPTLVPNRLHPLRTLLVNHLVTRFEDLEYAIIDDNNRLTLCGRNEPNNENINNNNSNNDNNDNDSTNKYISVKCDDNYIYNVTHAGYKVKTPFSSHRFQLIEYLVLLIEASDLVADEISIVLWKILIQWIFMYPHNNIYHHLFYRLFFAVIRYLVVL